jgi:Zn-dependent M28 family amino/carboxypeptidase
MRIVISHKSPLLYALLILSIFTTFTTSCRPTTTNQKENDRFDGEHALQNIDYQMDFGPRFPGSIGHWKVRIWIKNFLQKINWQTYIQEGEIQGQKVHNIIAKKGTGEPWIILGAHYDTRLYADQDRDKENRTLPVPGANDGASGVALLLELARVFPEEFPGEVWIVFFDAEDNGNIPGWDWILGSTYFIDQLDSHPDAMVLVDMIGDSDLNIYKERLSHQQLTDQIWEIADDLGFGDYFIPEFKYSILDDHLPFIQKGIPAIDIIDFDYPYWHTTEDTLDKVSAESLKIVGDTLIAWLKTYKGD